MLALRSTALYPFRRPLRTPFVSGGGTVSERLGVVVALTDAAGHRGLGEATPLEGYSPDSLDDAQAALARTLPLLEAGRFATFDDALTCVMRSCHDSPSAQAGLELALYDLDSQAHGKRLVDDSVAPESPPRERVPVNATIGALSLIDTVRGALEAADRGYSCIKLKVGNGSLDDDLQRVATVQRALAGRAALRVDANGAWSFELACSALRVLARLGVELVEEPVACLEELAALRRLALIPLAADESVRTPAQLERAIALQAADRLVLKPSCVGGLRMASQLARRAAEAGIEVVIGTALEGAIARAGATHLAAALPSLGGACGLATGDLWQDTLAIELPILAGAIELPARPGLGVRLTQTPSLSRGTSPSRRVSDAPQSRPALIDGGLRLSLGGLATRAARLARYLEGHGVGPGPDGRLVLVLEPSALAVVALHAAARLGATVALLHPRLPVEMLRAQSRRVRPACLIGDPDTAQRLRGESSDELTARFLGGPSTAGHSVLDTSWSTIPDTLLFTSGSTGNPHLVRLGEIQHRASALGVASRLGLGGGERWLLCMPLGHVGGLAVVTRAALLGDSVVVQRRFEPAAVSESLRQDRITLLSLVPTMLRRLLDDRPGKRFPATLKAILLGGAPTPPGLVEECAELGGLALPTYGLTEAASQVATRDPAARGPFHEGAVGRPLDGTALRIVAPQLGGEGRGCGPDEPGEIWVRGPTVMTGYLDDELATRRVLPDGPEGWLRTGDLGHLDEAGHLHVRGRLLERIISGGENVDPVEVESFLCTLPGVTAACVVGLPDPVWGEQVAAVLVGSFDPTLIEQRARAGLAPHQRPRLVVRAEELPETASGKTARGEVRRLLQSAANVAKGDHSPSRSEPAEER